MPVPYKNPLTLTVTVLGALALAAPQVTGTLTLEERTLPISVGSKTCLEFPQAPEGIQFYGGIAPLSVEARRLCLQGDPSLWGRSMEVGVRLGREFRLPIRFNQDTPETQLTVFLPQAPAQPAQAQAPAPTPTTAPANPAPAPASSANEGLWQALSELSKTMALLSQRLAMGAGPIPQPPAPTPAATPPAPPAPAPTPAQPPAPVARPSGSSVNVVAKEEASRGLIGTLTVRNGKLWVGFTLNNGEEHPYVLEPQGLRVLLNGKPLKGNANLRFTSGRSGWIPPRSSAVGGIELDVQPEPGKVQLEIEALRLDPTLSSVRWVQEWSLEFMPVVK
ncbi:MAG: hypothetical protein KatS3mg071_1647 [Meiothermus sp.]|nr:MAG: hypothetical protein KatS3mg071_1647 [Meiothermus sp.]